MEHLRTTAFTNFVLDLSKPVIEITNYNNIHEGDRVQLICKVDGSPPLHYTWFKDGVKLEINSKSLSDNRTAESLSYNKTFRNMTGSYKCQVNNTDKIEMSAVRKLDVLCK